ncbi:MAG: PEP-CTERM sorting domain-containing protein [Verrucomicrobiales bacterium]|nr:PEP-CTERM sorting domain-containing protein [Verrucomicrobiales bacterium]
MKFHLLPLALLAATAFPASAALFWTVGANDNDWPISGTDGGIGTDFVQENGVINALPGSATSGNTPQSSDNDYYFAGNYSSALAGNVASYGAYTPIGNVATDETGWERAYAGGDNDLRVHFNIPNSYGPNDLAVITFDALNLHNDGGQSDPRYGVEVWFNGVKVRAEQVIRPADLHVAQSTLAFTLGSVGAVTGPGADNIVSLRGINYNGSGGGNWMGFDYVSMDLTAVPEPGSAVLLGGLLAGAVLLRRRRCA